MTVDISEKAVEMLCGELLESSHGTAKDGRAFDLSHTSDLLRALRTKLTDTEAKLAEAKKSALETAELWQEAVAKCAALQSQLSSAEARGLERAAQAMDAEYNFHFAAAVTLRQCEPPNVEVSKLHDAYARQASKYASAIRALITSPMPSQPELGPQYRTTEEVPSLSKVVVDHFTQSKET